MLKQNFLNKCKAFAPNLVVQGEIPHDLDKVQIVTARAFKPIDVILDITRAYHAKNGKYFLLKGRQEKIQRFKNQVYALEIPSHGRRTPPGSYLKNLLLKQVFCFYFLQLPFLINSFTVQSLIEVNITR